MIFPFYEKALALFAKTQKQQIIKGLKKYPEPFNPHSWTPEELLNHALEETVDLTHYLVGLKELLDVKDIQIKDLRNEIELLDSKLRKIKDKETYVMPAPGEVVTLKGNKPEYNKCLVPDLSTLEKLKMEKSRAITGDPLYWKYHDTDDQY